MTDTRSESRKTRARPRKPGRPKESGQLRDLIFDKAELVFAEHGFLGAGLRDIAALAGVNPAMIRYYFGSKEELFEEVVRRRGKVIGAARDALLDALLERGDFQVADVVHAYLKPQWDMKHSSANGEAFVRLQARLHAEPEEHALRLRRELYDATAKRYIATFCRLLPDMPKETVSLRMAFLVGTYLFMLNDLGRLDDLTDGRMRALEKHDMLMHLVSFLTAGMTAPLRPLPGDA